MSVSVARGSRGGSATTYGFGLSKAIPFFQRQGGPAAHIPGSDSSKTPGLLSRILPTKAPEPPLASSSTAYMPSSAYSRSFSILPSGAAADTYIYEASIASRSSKSSRYSWSSSSDSYSPYRRSMLFNEEDDDTCSVDSEAERRDPREVVPSDLASLIAPMHTGFAPVPLPPPSAVSSGSSDSNATMTSPTRVRTPAPASFITSRPAIERRASAAAAASAPPPAPPPGLTGPHYPPAGAPSYPPAPGPSYPPVSAPAYPPASAPAYPPASAPAYPPTLVPVPPPPHVPTSAPASVLGPPPLPRPSVPVRAATYPPRDRRASTTAAPVPYTSTHSGPPPPQQLPLEGLVDPHGPRALMRTSSLHTRPLPPRPSSSSPPMSSPTPRPSAPGPAAHQRGVRWSADLICPSPVPAHARRKGFFNRRGDQLWTNEGAYRPAKPGEEFPADLAAYPAPGMGWMNEEGVRIDMRHRRVTGPWRSALKKARKGEAADGGAAKKS